MISALCSHSVRPEPLPKEETAVVVNEVRITTSRCGDMSTAVAALASGEFAVEGLIEATYPLERLAEAMDEAVDRMKVLVDPAD